MIFFAKSTRLFVPFLPCFELVHRDVRVKSYGFLWGPEADGGFPSVCQIRCDSVRSIDQLDTRQKRQEKLWRFRTFVVPSAQDHDWGSGDECQNSLKCSRGHLGLRIPRNLWLPLARCDFDLSMSQLDTWQKRHVELSRLRIFFVQIAQDYDQG